MSEAHRVPDFERELQQARATGVTAVIPWLYWSDDISAACVENGCTDRYQGVWKDKATWARLANELADLVARSSGRGAIIVIEPEFNKNGIENYEPFDGYLEEQAAIFHRRGLRVATGFGNWGQNPWTNFDRTVSVASDAGVQGRRRTGDDLAAARGRSGVRHGQLPRDRRTLLGPAPLERQPEDRVSMVSRRPVGSPPTFLISHFSFFNDRQRLLRRPRHHVT